MDNCVIEVFGLEIEFADVTGRYDIRPRLEMAQPTRT